MENSECYNFQHHFKDVLHGDVWVPDKHPRLGESRGHAAALGLFLSLAVDFPAVTDGVNDEQPLLANGLVDDSIVSLSRLEQPGKAPMQRLRSDFLEVFSQPADAVGDAADYRTI